MRTLNRVCCVAYLRGKRILRRLLNFARSPSDEIPRPWPPSAHVNGTRTELFVFWCDHWADAAAGDISTFCRVC
jgi:hypothetical protein